MGRHVHGIARGGAVLIILGASLSCAGNPAQPTPLSLGQPFELRAGAGTIVDGLGVTFLQVNGDSRCPMDAVCVWAGEGMVTLLVSQPTPSPLMAVSLVIGAIKAGTCAGESSQARCVLTTTPSGSSASHDGHTFRLVQLAPYPRSAVSIRPEDYVATLVVSR